MATDLWETLLGIALVGTERQPLTLPAVPPPLDQFVQKLGDRPDAFLSLATAVNLYQSAGILPEQTRQPLPIPCAVEKLPCCSARASQDLQVMLQGEHSNLLSEWLTVAAAMDLRVPAHLLPALLKVGATQTKLRSLILPVLGERGQWLAVQNPDWCYGINNDEDIWETGTKAQRWQWLEKQRQQHPDRARDQLQHTWKQEPADHRAAFLQTLQTNLSLADQDFLETCLDDRSKEVRQVAVALLSQLPASQFGQRLVSYLKPLIRVEEDRVTITPPAELNAAMIRDGLTLAERSGTGQRASWLQQLLSAIPGDWWQTELGLSPTALLAQTAESEWFAALWNGWESAARQQHHPDWLTALLIQGTTALEQLGFLRLANLFDALPQERQSLVLGELQQTYADEELSLYGLGLLCATQVPWSTTTADLFLCLFQQKLGKGQVDWSLSYALPRIALQIPIASIPAFLHQELQPPPQLASAISQFLDTLQFRYAMIAALLPESG